MRSTTVGGWKNVKTDVYNMLYHGVSANAALLWESKKAGTSSEQRTTTSNFTISKTLKTATLTKNMKTNPI
jgi:hypothetical protein